MGNLKQGYRIRPMLLILAVLGLAIAGGGVWVLRGDVEVSPQQEPATVGVDETTNPVTGDKHYTLSIPMDREQPQASQDLWKAFQEILRVERTAPFEDPKAEARAVAKRDYNQVRQQVKELEGQGLEGEGLYAAIEERLTEEGAEGALKMLEGYRRLEEDLARVDLDKMGPEERFAYVVEARRNAFGQETADKIFFEKEAYTQYKLEERAIVEATGLTEPEKEAEITGRRNALQVELASRGSYVSFADERRDELDRRLRERYGESVASMSGEERRAAVLALYTDELPPETIGRVEQILAAQTARREAFKAYQGESEAILNDPDLSFEEKQERLAELSAQYDALPPGVGP